MGSALKSSLPSSALNKVRTTVRIHPTLWVPRSRLTGETRRLTTIQLYARNIATLFLQVNRICVIGFHYRSGKRGQTLRAARRRALLGGGPRQPRATWTPGRSAGALGRRQRRS